MPVQEGGKPLAEVNALERERERERESERERENQYYSLKRLNTQLNEIINKNYKIPKVAKPTNKKPLL